MAMGGGESMEEQVELVKEKKKKKYQIVNHICNDLVEC